MPRLKVLVAWFASKARIMCVAAFPAGEIFNGASKMTWNAKQIDGKKSPRRLLNMKAAAEPQVPSELLASGGCVSKGEALPYIAVLPFALQMTFL